jgi:hypothetical protein
MNKKNITNNPIVNMIKTHITNKSFYLGALMSVGMFSQYIFGADNLAEQTVEYINKTLTGQDIDFSKEDINTKDTNDSIKKDK